jgi:ABC-type transport system involved in multi-copper enzyme maturation permease subunit
MTGILIVAGNTLRAIFDRRALYIWGAAIVLMLLRSAPALLADGDETVREVLRAQAVSGSLETWSVLCIAAAIFIGGSAIAAEIVSKTLITVIARPVPRWQVLAGKWIGVVVFCLLSMAIGLALALGAAAYAGVSLNVRALAFALAQTASAIALYGALAVGLSAVSSSIMAASLTILVVFAPALASVFEADSSPAFHRLGIVLNVGTPGGYASRYSAAVRLPERALARSAFLRSTQAPIDGHAERSRLIENATHTLFYLLAGCVAFARRDVKL